MHPFELTELLHATGARPLSGPSSATLRHVSTDSRTCPPEDALFLALSGPRHDGNRYALGALERGARAVLVGEGRAPDRAELRAKGGFADRAILEHPDPQEALLSLARWYRSLWNIPVVGVGGSNGKTTTKEILGHLLGRSMPTVRSEKSFNNSVGVPATLFRIDGATRAAVVEIGTSARGEIARLADVARPTIAIVTIVAEEHLEGLGSIEGVAEEEGDLLAALPAEGVAILNADDRFHPELRRRAPGRVVTFGIEHEADLVAREVVFHVAGCSFFVDGRPATLPLLGTHNVYNALGAVAAATALGLSLEQALAGLGDLRTPQRRLERKTFGDVEILDDSYNANPASVRAAIRALEGLRVGRRRVLVLGCMHELGSDSPRLHREVGRAAGAADLDLLVAVGAESGSLLAGATETGMSSAKMIRFPATEDAAAALGDLLRPGDLVLVKGSRAEGLERVVDAIARRFSPERETSA